LVTSHNELAEAVLDRLAADAPAVALRMADAARAEVAEYAAVRDAGFGAEVLAHAEEHVHAFVECTRRGRPLSGAELDFVRERGARRARELLSLDALLEAYLIGQRTIWEAIAEAAGDSPEGLRVARELTAVTFEYTHAINVALAAAYVRERQALTSDSERGRRDLLDRLLAGGGADGAEMRRAEALGLRPDAQHVVVVAPGPDDGDHLRFVQQALALDDRGASFVVARNDEVTAILPVFVRRGPLEVRAALDLAAGRLSRTYGVTLQAGVSSVCHALADVGRGYGEAKRALRHAPDAGAVAIEEIGLLDYLIEQADDSARRLVPPAAHALMAEDRRQGGVLTATLQAYADCDLNVARAAALLVVHPNTVHYRLGRVEGVTGRDPRRLSDLLELLLAIRLSESLANS
jgi:DNA-binding PucR family transcriptional regulator